jgi:monofunctional glycosyltransferase
MTVPVCALSVLIHHSRLALLNVPARFGNTLGARLASDLGEITWRQARRDSNEQHGLVKKPSPKSLCYIKRVAVIAWIILMIPPAQVVYVRMTHPTTTVPMALRSIKRSLGIAGQARADYIWVPLEHVPTFFLACVLQGEDDHFFQHYGFDWPAIMDAWRRAKATGQPAVGASTISQQCARSLFLWSARSWVRKVLEAYYTAWMEVVLSKRRILELYVNVIETGDGIYGIQAAAKHYYGVDARELSREQAAMLVAILPNPKKLNPREPSEALRSRQMNILQWTEHVKQPIDIRK